MTYAKLLILSFFFNSGLTAASGLSMQDLQLASQTIYGYWMEEDLVIYDEVGWSGSSFVTEDEGNTLILITNRHCVGLDDIESMSCNPILIPDEEAGLPGLFEAGIGTAVGVAEEIANTELRIIDYELIIVFDTGVEVPVESFSLAQNHDLAYLRIDKGSLLEGVDYVIVPESAGQSHSLGDEVVAVGSPLGLPSSLTFGRISALREGPSYYSENTTVPYIQTDAAINHGNSGGPLFLEVNDKYWWIGVNSMRFDNADNLGFAIESRALNMASFSRWYACNKFGLCDALWIFHSIDATPVD